MSTSASTTPRQGFNDPTFDDDDEPLANLAAPALNSKRISFLPSAPRSELVVPVSRPANNGKIGSLNSSQTSSTESVEEKDKRSSPTKQTRQEAQEILHRQKIAKDIGDQTSALPPRPVAKHQSQSAPNLLSFGTLPTVSEDAGKSNSDDDDDDIPLAVLQAHNFVNKTKTPDPKLSQNSYIGTSGRPGSTLGAPSVISNRTSLPPFARRLPQDPYGSAQSVLNDNASRDSMLLNRPSIYPQGQSPVPGLPPGGLVGVIAEEEKMKSIRRAGPDMGGKSALPHMGASPMGMNPAMSMGMGGLNIPGLGAGMGAPMMQMAAMQQDQGQINQQLLQVVQQQTFMLQTMYAQMQAQMGMPMSPMTDMGNGFEVPGSPRPMSIVNGAGRPGNPRTQSMVNLQRPNYGPRTMSMINTTSPFAQNWNGPAQEPLINSARSVHGLGVDGYYAPSVAPSERSNVGQPSRYRPVTNSHLAETQSTYAPEPSVDMDGGKKKKSGFFSAIMHPKGKASDFQGAGGEEEEDWSNFAKKRRSAMPSSFR
jgi:hypothetical protein